MEKNNIQEYVSGLMERAHAAQKQIEHYTQAQVDELIAAVAWATVQDARAAELAQMALEESGMGDYDAKFGKFKNKVPGVLYDLKYQKSVGVIEELPERGIVKVAKPVGVVGCLIPSTQPEMTPVVKAMFAIKGRNAAVFSPHPKTAKTTLKCVEYMREALEKYGAPKDLLICAENPNIEMSNEIMRQSDLVVATGGKPMVKAAYSSGKPAYGVGVGNSVVIVDETADLADAAKKITISKTFDNASGCSCENSLVIKDTIYDDMIAALTKEGAYMCNAEEKQKVQNTLWVNGALNRDVITQPVAKIAALAGIEIPEGTKYLLVEEVGSGKEYPFSGEKLSLVITVYKYTEIDDAIAIINANQAYQGAGHSCGIHSFNEEHIQKVFLNTKTTRVMVRQGMNTGNSGNWINGMPWTVTLGCGTWGGNVASENITLKHFINTTWVSKPIEREIPSLEEIFGDVMNK